MNLELDALGVLGVDFAGAVGRKAMGLKLAARGVEMGQKRFPLGILHFRTRADQKTDNVGRKTMKLLVSDTRHEGTLAVVPSWAAAQS